MRDQNVADAILGHAANTPARPAILTTTGTATFAQWAAALGGVAAGLDERQIAPASVVGILVDDSPAALRAILGTMLGGRVALPLDADAPPAEIERLLALTGAAAVVTDRARAWSVPTFGIDTLPASANPTAVRRPGGEAMAQIAISSGTSGPAKASPASHAQLIERVETLSPFLGLGPDDRHRPLITMGFVLGRYPAMRTLAAGGAVVMTPLPKTVGELVGSLAADGITYLTMTPTHVAAMLEQLPPGRPPAMPFIRVFMVSSAMVPLAMRAAIRARLTPNLHVSLGSNEVGTITHAGPADLAREPATVGRPLPGIAVEVVDADDRPVAAGAIGAVRVRTAAAAGGYLGDPATSARAYRDGWFHLGDTGHLDEDGYLFLHGRLDDRINQSGRKLYPFEIEDALLTHPAIAEAAAFGLAVRNGIEVAVAAVVLRQPVTTAEIRRHCLPLLGEGKMPRMVFAFDALPRNAARKVLIPELRQQVLARLTAANATGQQ
ncbi:long-chain acyl-CoA synthetase [Stella humosa]|uniref:Long-chain acyl-CoA synthetase n=1 Tax=Stella humosa TaxID=94 RepID=A0A3N1M7D3_9PROT|nr:class I adenylate-forming enzyme family protein [Stella humosa]ROP99622.1 long-chain acyl-CoA synthetase [Stella humosa]BBK31153.1 long-chain-fatty-acid--CoA ligase [Stella humosa]